MSEKDISVIITVKLDDIVNQLPNGLLLELKDLIIEKLKNNVT